MARAKIDWEKGEKLYRLGQLTATEIARQLGCPTSTVTRHMQSKGVLQDMSEEVQRRTQAALAAGHSCVENATQCKLVAEVTEEDIQAAVDTNVALVMSHRKDIQRIADIEQKLLNELEDNPTKLYIAQYQGGIVQEVVGLTVSEKAATLLALENVQAKRIGLQRQAFNIVSEVDADGAKSNCIEIKFRGHDPS